jgi:ATP-dependent DNA helicase PIF1
MLIPASGETPLKQLIQHIYGDLHTMPHTDLPGYLAMRGILAPKNDVVDGVNQVVLDTAPGEEREYMSADSVREEDDNDDANGTDWTQEFLNSVNVAGLPPSKLKLKIGCPIMLLRNICAMQGLYNGTRLMVLRLGHRCIHGRIITEGKHNGRTAFIPRATMNNDTSNNRLPFVLQRRQFPVGVAYAMTINKAQGQTVPHVGVYLPEPVFSHGQLYVSMSRVKSKHNIKMLFLNSTSAEGKTYTKNIVYREVLRDQAQHGL